MQLPLQITFRNMEPLPEAEKWIGAETKKLETFYSRIMGCRVAVEVPHGHHRKGRLYHIRIDLTLPGQELVIKHEPSLSKEVRRTGGAQMKKGLEVRVPHRNLRLAIRDAFKAAGRRLQDYARRRRGDVKVHEPRSVARVSKLLPEEGYGFLTTADGREIYFHERSVLNRGFRRLHVGSEVSFVEEQGEKGPQASTVRDEAGDLPASWLERQQPLDVSSRFRRAQAAFRGRACWEAWNNSVRSIRFGRRSWRPALLGVSPRWARPPSS